MENLTRTPKNQHSESGPPSSFLLAGLVALLLVMVATTNAQDARAPYFLRPDSADAGVAFDLQLLSHRFDCATTYSHQSVKVEGKRVTLSFLATEHPEAICPAVVMPYGPVFRMDPLMAGYYDVYARRLAPCMVAGNPGDPVCMMEVVPEFAGVLAVGVTDRRGWFLQPREVIAEQAFTMHILNHAYGNCHTSFSREVLEKRNGAFYASFVIQQHPDHVCVTDIRPHGPSFEVRGQPVGKYPVFANPQPPCRYNADRPCLTSSSPDRWIPVDTLEVTKDGPTGVLPGGSDLSPRVEFPRGTVEGYRPDGRKSATLPENP